MINYFHEFENHLRILWGLSRPTVSAYLSKIHEFYSWLKSQKKSTDPKEITRYEIEHYLEHLFYVGNKNITRTTKLIALTRFSRYLRYKGVIERDFTEGIPRLKITKKIMLFFSRDDIYKFFRQCDPQKEKGLRDVCILILLAFCGLRMNEIITLDINSIIDDGQDIEIFVQGKQGHDRQIYLWKVPGKFIRQYLMARLTQGAHESEPFLVSYRRGQTTHYRLYSSDIQAMIKNLARKAEIRRPRIHAHMFRTTHANDLQSIKGYILPAIQERLGWKDLSTASRYLVRRERIHKTYDSLHAYWREFAYLWLERKEDQNNEPGGTIAEVG